jgi:aldehyde:ferredoxin oxidoreductase
LKGFAGKLLVVNLNNKKITDEPLNKEIAQNFLGGAGYCCKYLYDKIDFPQVEGLLYVRNLL